MSFCVGSSLSITRKLRRPVERVMEECMEEMEQKLKLTEEEKEGVSVVESANSNIEIQKLSAIR